MKVPFIQILVEVEVKVVKPHFKVNTTLRMVDIVNMKVNFVEVDNETVEKGEVMEVVVKVIEVNNQTTIQTTTIAKNLSIKELLSKGA